MLARSRHILALARIHVERSDRLDPLRSRLLSLSAREIETVDWLWRATRRGGVRRTVILISWFGNWIAYLIFAAVLLITTNGVFRPLVVAAVGVAIGHVVYPWVKLACQRPRPFNLRHHLLTPLQPLDHYSFPSGHVMTLTAALAPFVIAYPFVWPEAVVLWLLMAWSRVASAHHYPSDVLAGAAMGFAVAAISNWLITT
jgi:undecaprenyl-diphosphatase